MKILLKELINPNTAILNDTQKAVLVLTHISPTEKLAFDATSKADNLARARDTLVRMGLVRAGNNRMFLTDMGEEMLTHHNLIDDAGELSDDARNILDQIDAVGKKFNDSETQQESFEFLSSLL